MILVAFIVFFAVIAAAVMAPSSKYEPKAAPVTVFPLLEGAADEYGLRLPHSVVSPGGTL